MQPIRAGAGCEQPGDREYPGTRQRNRIPSYSLPKLIIKALGRSNFFTVEFTSTDREKAAMIVNEVAEGYIAFQQQTQATRNMRTVEEYPEVNRVGSKPSWRRCGTRCKH